MTDTLSTIAQIIAAEINRAHAPKVCPEITSGSRFERDLNCQPIDMVCISIEIEDEFEIALVGEALEACSTVGDLARLVDRLRTKEPARG